MEITEPNWQKYDSFRVQKAFMVYQVGLANVFKVSAFNLADYGRDAERIYQGSFNGARQFCYGLALNGTVIRTCHCNKPGDIINEKWSEDLENAPFQDDIIELKLN